MSKPPMGKSETPKAVSTFLWMALLERQENSHIYRKLFELLARKLTFLIVEQGAKIKDEIKWIESSGVVYDWKQTPQSQAHGMLKFNIQRPNHTITMREQDGFRLNLQQFSTVTVSCRLKISSPTFSFRQVGPHCTFASCEDTIMVAARG